MYTNLAHLYDWPGSQSFSTDMAERIRAFLSQQKLSDISLLDVACGTGDLSIALAKQGHHVTGVDLSEAMLNIAEEKKQALDTAIQKQLTFQPSDMRTLTQTIAENSMDTVVCTCDSLNHLTDPNDLSNTLKQIHLCLKPDGWFIFDTNTQDNYTQFWQGKDTYEGPNYQLRAESIYNPDTKLATITYSAFEHLDDGLVEYTDAVDERFYSDNDVKSELAENHFTIHSTEAFNPPEIENLVEEGVFVKQLWICQKQA